MADYSQMFANPWFNMGLGILGANRPGASFGQAVGQGGLLGMQNYQAQMEYQQKQEELKRMLAAQSQVAEMSPEIGPILQAYPNAAPQILGSLYKSPSDAPSNVREWQYFSQLPEAEQQQYLTMKRANQWLDQGGYNVMPSPLNPMAPMAVLPKSLPPQDLPQVRGAQAQAAEVGRVMGERQTTEALDFPQVKEKTEYAVQLLDDLVKEPGLKGAVGFKGPGLAYGLRETPIPGSKEADFFVRLEQLQGQQFLEAFESLKGGGQITEVEGKKATDAAARMSTAQTEAAFKSAAREYRNILITGLRRRAAQQGIDYKYQPQKPPEEAGVINFEDLPSVKRGRNNGR